LIVRSYSHYMAQQGFSTRYFRRALVDQQLWFLGRDICATAGNALTAFGFQRRRAPADVVGSSAYVLPSPQLAGSSHADDVLICWGFGLYLGGEAASDTGANVLAMPPHDHRYGLLLERFGRGPRLVPTQMPRDVHHVTALPKAIAPATPAQREALRTRLVALSGVLAAYERWAIASLGHSHREMALREIPRHKRQRFLPITELSDAWETLGAQLSAVDGVTTSSDRAIA
jgi:hypothetical protein